jgi:hypothetical protein
MTTPNRLIEHRAERLAALASPGLGVKLPAAVARAITGYQACQQASVPAPPQPGQAARQAIAGHAADLADAALGAGRAPADPDPAKVAAAREREQAALDRAAIAAEVRAAATIGLCRITDEHLRAVLAAIRAAHAEAITDLTGHARQLPPGADGDMALQQGGAIREHYLAAVDLIARAEQLREVFRFVEDAQPGGYAPDLMEMAVTYLRTPMIYDRREDTSGGTPWGPLGSIPFYLGVCREADPGDWWLPTHGERDERAAAIHEERRVARVKAGAGL